MLIAQKRTKNAVFLCCLVFLVACTSNPMQEEVIIFAASSLTESFTELETSFELVYPGVDVVLNFGSSATLLTQIQDSSRADVFASADLDHIQVLIDEGLVSQRDSSVFAANEMLVVLPSSNTAIIAKIEDLASPGLRIVMALPEVPAGAYARQTIAALDTELGPGFEEALLMNLVSSEDNVRQVLLKVELGEADAGIVYSTDALATKDLGTISIPEAFQPGVLYSMGILKEARNGVNAQAFFDFVLSEKGQAILQSWGFLAAESLDRTVVE